MNIRPIDDFDNNGWFAHSSRPANVNLNTIVLHATAGGNLSGAVSTLRAKGYGYHFLIDKNGDTWKGAPALKKVGHAGESVGPNGRWCNSYSIGVCFVNENNGVVAITAQQMVSLLELLPLLAPNMAAYTWLTTHYAITVKPDGSYRKSDPRLVDVPAIAAAVGLQPWKPTYASKYAL